MANHFARFPLSYQVTAVITLLYGVFSLITAFLETQFLAESYGNLPPEVTRPYTAAILFTAASGLLFLGSTVVFGVVGNDKCCASTLRKFL